MKKWKPKAHEFFYYITTDGVYSPEFVVGCEEHIIGNKWDKAVMRKGNCFKTKKRAMEVIKLINKLIKEADKEE